MNYLKDLKEQITFDQLLLIFTCFSFTFPFYILGPILLIEFIYLLVSKKAIIALKQTPQIKFLYLFVLISLSISIIHKNILGALATLGIFIVIIFCFPLFLLSLFGFNGENISYVFLYLIKFLFRQKSYLFSKDKYF